MAPFCDRNNYNLSYFVQETPKSIAMGMLDRACSAHFIVQTSTHVQRYLQKYSHSSDSLYREYTIELAESMESLTEEKEARVLALSIK